MRARREGFALFNDLGRTVVVCGSRRTSRGVTTLEHVISEMAEGLRLGSLTSMDEAGTKGRLLLKVNYM